jgi:hypothetical protein
MYQEIDRYRTTHFLLGSVLRGVRRPHLCSQMYLELLNDNLARSQVCLPFHKSN